MRAFLVRSRSYSVITGGSHPGDSGVIHKVAGRRCSQCNGVVPEGTYTAISAGDEFTCGLKTDGSIVHEESVQALAVATQASRHG